MVTSGPVQELLSISRDRTSNILSKCTTNVGINNNLKIFSQNHSNGVDDHEEGQSIMVSSKQNLQSLEHNY